MGSRKWDGQIWVGVFKTFEDAMGEQDVFEGSIWLEKQISQAKFTIEQSHSKETISKLALTSEYSLPVIAATIAHPDQTLRILDFGGGLGTSFLPLKAMLTENQPLDFIVIENEAICKEGESLFKDEKQITFFNRIPGDEKFDIIHAGSSFHYVDDWIEHLRLFSQMDPKYLIFADLPAGDIDTFITIQNYNDRKIPVRFWNLCEFIDEVEKLGFRLIMRARYHSNYLNYMNSFDQDHRLTHFSQMVFKLSK
jgi:putative methyltransferase (TIGR04325 family)